MFFLSDECRGNDICKCGIREILELCYRFAQEIYEVSNLDAFNVSSHQVRQSE